MPEAEIEEATSSSEISDFLVFNENQGPLQVLISMQTQWRTGGMAGALVGLDYNVAPWVMKMCGIDDSEQSVVFQGLRIAEDEFIRVVMKDK